MSENNNSQRMGNPQSPNQLLAALPESEYQRLAPHLTEVSLDKETVIFEALEPIETVYFPHSVLISIVSILENGLTTEIAIIGRSGMVDLSAIFGNKRSINRAVVQVAGRATKIATDIFKREFDRSEELQRILLRYTSTRISELSQLAACNNHHTIEERLARWLLTVHDLVESDNLPLTQELIGQMLGVRRASVTVTARTFQQAGIIRYTRGNIIIVDREALEATACECYGIIRQQYESI